jgi:hypothetical protein
MATAKYELNNPVEVMIQPGGTVPLADENLQVPDNTPVEFQNDATFPVNLVFTSLFGTINVPAGQLSAPVTSSQVTVNYTIYNALNNQPTGGPYSIQWGQGVMAISITGGNPTPQNITIAKGAQIQFTSDAVYPIAWTPPNSFTPEPPDVQKGQNGAQRAAAYGKTVSYGLTDKSGVVRGGTVKIGS